MNLKKELLKGIREDELYEDFLMQAKTEYTEMVNSIIGTDSGNRDMFSWFDGNLTIHFVYKQTDLTGNPPLIFATPFREKEFIKYDFLKETESFLDKKESNAHKIISILYSKELFEFPSEEILSSSVYYSPLGVSPYQYAKSFVDREYNGAIKDLRVRPIELVKFNDVKLHMDLMNFDEILKGLSNDQFQSELLECIDSYNNQHFFVAAAGLGSVIEHLLFLIIEKHNLIDRSFPRDPTIKDYIRYMKKEPINLDHRSKSYIDSLFIQRNAISHYNTGFSSKSTCDQMLQGIKNIFDNHYDLQV